MKSCKYHSNLFNFDVYVMHPEGLKSLLKIRDMITEMQPELMIELGTAYGGFTALMYDACPTAKFYTYDKFRGENILNRAGGVVTKEMCIEWRIALQEKGVIFVIQDILEEPCGSLENLCSDGRRKIMYCDNGNKPFEVAFYGPHLNPGDVMGVHDWKQEIWPHQAPAKSVLKHHFRPHTINDKLREVRSLSRFFVKK
jgi:cephalosporin hydroxylase